jgi:hypothetical protein
VTNCLTCTADNSKCTKCKKTYFLSSNSCGTTVAANCDSPSAAGKCLNCNAGYGITTASTAGSCTACKASNCATCAVYTKCTKCKKYYFLTTKTAEMSGATATVPLCKNVALCAAPTGAATCSKCDDGYGYSTSTAPCVACATTNCKLCQKTKATCTKCKTYYFLDSSAKC